MSTTATTHQVAGARRLKARTMFHGHAALARLVAAVSVSVFMIVGRADANTYTVINTSGSSGTSGSLPWAVLQANNRAGFDRINFNIPGSGVKAITIGSTLFLNDQVAVNGATQPGYSGAPLIYVQGSANVTSVFLLQGTSSGSTIQGLGMYNYTSNGVTILSASTNNWIQNNYIGFYKAGGSPVLLNSTIHSLTRGIGIQSSFNTIRDNTISGVDNAITLGEDPSLPGSGTAYKTNSIQYNRIGTDPTGMFATGYGNTSDGVILGGGGRENFIGPGNVLSGNASSGVELFHSTVIGNVVFANRIGTNATGTAAIPNGELGVLLSNGANGNAVGGAFGGNLISANTYGGVSLGTDLPAGFIDAANGNWVQNNIMGLDVNQSVSLGGQQVGISISNGSTGNDVESNVLAGHTQHGAILGNVVSNSVSNNWIGMSTSGAPMPNAAYGIVFIDASYNYATGNAFGSNPYGNIGSFGTSCCNVTP